MTATVRERQSVFDIALQYFGSVEASIMVAERLGCGVTDRLTVGDTFEYRDDEVIDRVVVNHYQRNNIIPTTDEWNR